MLACNQPVSNATVPPAINEEKEKCDATDFIGIRVPTNDRDRHVHSQRKRDIDKHAIVRYRRLLKRHRNQLFAECLFRYTKQVDIYLTISTTGTYMGSVEPGTECALQREPIHLTQVPAIANLTRKMSCYPNFIGIALPTCDTTNEKLFSNI